MAAAVDRRAGVEKGASATHAAAVVTSDTVDLAFVADSLYVGGAGDVKVITRGGDTVTFKSVPAGTTLNVRVKRVFALGTSATLIVALS